MTWFGCPKDMLVTQVLGPAPCPLATYVITCSLMYKLTYIYIIIVQYYHMQPLIIINKIKIIATIKYM